jgi:hypothetical protein
MDNGLTWTECAVPNRDYAMSNPDMAILEKCAVPSTFSDDDKKIMAQRIPDSSGMEHDLQLTIGSNTYEARLVDIDKTVWHYELTRNGVVISKATAQFWTYDPNQNLWDINGHLVWELAASPSTIIVDGVDYNQKYQLEGAYFPYEINGKLIYIAEKNGKYSVVYDGENIGPEFDDISMPYCCGMVYLFRGNGQYWFVGSRDGTKYVVSIQ